MPWSLNALFEPNPGCEDLEVPLDVVTGEFADGATAIDLGGKDCVRGVKRGGAMASIFIVWAIDDVLIGGTGAIHGAVEDSKARTSSGFASEYVAILTS
jgi:hypothetical protein